MYRVETIAFHITKACSHKCPFCYASSSNKAKKPSYETLVQIIKAIASQGVKELVFVGGDPCSYPSLLELCQRAKEFTMHTTVVSNTHVYPLDQAEQITEIIDCFETTIHGPTYKEHDSIALKEGALKSVLNNLKVLCDKAKSIGIIYNITPQSCRQLFDSVDNLIDKEGIPIDHIILQRIIPQGRGRTTSRFMIGCAHAVATLEEIERITAKYRHLSISFEDPFPFCVVPERFHKYLTRCEWGLTRAAIDCEGNLSRCGADPRYRLGNILKTPLLDIWKSSSILTNFRSRKYLPQGCHDCNLLEHCGGGCALSCEIESDHGPDYLYYERTKTILPTGTSFTIRLARRENLSDILRIEWASFPEYEFKFTPESILKWYTYNPKMFYILEDSREHVLGYACLVPLTERGYSNIINGKTSSLQELNFSDVKKISIQKGGYWHIEVLSTIADVRSRAGRTLIKMVGEFLIDKANLVTASPITYMGIKLCSYFGFKKMATEKTKSSTYDIYMLKVEPKHLAQTLGRF